MRTSLPEVRLAWRPSFTDNEPPIRVGPCDYDVAWSLFISALREGDQGAIYIDSSLMLHHRNIALAPYIDKTGIAANPVQRESA